MIAEENNNVPQKISVPEQMLAAINFLEAAAGKAALPLMTHLEVQAAAKLLRKRFQIVPTPAEKSETKNSTQ
jgi:hypothetical protein